MSVENNTKLHLCLFGHGTKTNYVKPCIPQTQHKVTQPLLIFIRNGVLVFRRSKRFPVCLVNCSILRRTRNCLPLTPCLNWCFKLRTQVSIAVRADVLLEVEKYLPSSSSDSAVKLSQNFCRKSTNGDEVAHAFLQQKRLSDTLHQSVRRNRCVYDLKAAF